MAVDTARARALFVAAIERPRAGAAGPRRPRLDRDEGPGEGAGAAVRLGYRPRERRRAVSRARAGLGRPADGGLSPEEVRPAEPATGGGGGAGPAGAGPGRGRDDARLVGGPAAGGSGTTASVARRRRGQREGGGPPGRSPPAPAGRGAAGAGDENERDPRLDLPGPAPQEHGAIGQAAGGGPRGAARPGHVRDRGGGARATRWPWPGCRSSSGNRRWAWTIRGRRLRSSRRHGDLYRQARGRSPRHAQQPERSGRQPELRR